MNEPKNCCNKPISCAKAGGTSFMKQLWEKLPESFKRVPVDEELKQQGYGSKDVAIEAMEFLEGLLQINSINSLVQQNNELATGIEKLWRLRVLLTTLCQQSKKQSI